MTPCSCAASSAAAICRAIGSASFTAMGPRAMRSASVSPATSSMTMAVTAPELCKPWICAMFGWFSDASTRASRAKRARRSASSANSGDRTFTATSRFSSVSRARYTCPMPPAPIILPITRVLSRRPVSTVSVEGSMACAANAASGCSRNTSARETFTNVASSSSRIASSSPQASRRNAARSAGGRFIAASQMSSRRRNLSTSSVTQRHPSAPSSRASHTFASRQSRITVCGET